MTQDEFRHALGQVIVDSQPIPIEQVIEMLQDEIDLLKCDLKRQKHSQK
jgi:uncharacterized small protein (DUF1192 family)